MKNLYLAFRIWLATRRANKTYRALRAIRDSKRSGFTLIDLSICLIIIGLIVGGMLVGQEAQKAKQRADGWQEQSIEEPCK